MEQSLSPQKLAAYTARQINTFYPDDDPVAEDLLAMLLPRVLERLALCCGGFGGARFRRAGALFFDHLNSDQYSMFLYLLANEAFRSGGVPGGVAAKAYLLNKALHGLEVFYEVELPEVFWFAHAVGAVLGRARYGNGLVVMQGCTVGNKLGSYPVFGEKVVLCAHSTVLGDTRIGSGVCLGARSLLVDEIIPDDSTVVGATPNLRILRQRAALIDRYFAETLPSGVKP